MDRYTWTLEELLMGRGSSNGDWARSLPPNAQIIYKIGIYGWRKRCLYVFILLLMITVIINLALTIWILKVMDFSMHGMGKLRIVPEGVRVEGNAEFLKSITAAHIKSKGNSGLFVESARNITIYGRDADNNVVNTFFIGDKKISSQAKEFEIRNTAGKLLFYADEKKVLVGADELAVKGRDGSGGASFTGSVQTPLLRSDASDLRVESPTSQLHVSAPDGVNIKAPVGGIDINSLLDVKITSRGKAIRLDAKSISLKNLKVSQPAFDGRPYPEVFQLCICGRSGKLFLSPARGNCQATSSVCD